MKSYKKCWISYLLTKALNNMIRYDAIVPPSQEFSCPGAAGTPGGTDVTHALWMGGRLELIVDY